MPRPVLRPGRRPSPRPWSATRQMFLRQTAARACRSATSRPTSRCRTRRTARCASIVPTRGDPSIAWVDWDGERRLSCNRSGEAFALCDDDAPAVVRPERCRRSSRIPDEPFGVFADTRGRVRDRHAPDHRRGHADRLAARRPRAGHRRRAAASSPPIRRPACAARPASPAASPHAAGDIIYVGSRSEDRIQTFTVGRPVNDAPPFLLAGQLLLPRRASATRRNGGSTDTRGMAFSPTRRPPVPRQPPAADRSRSSTRRSAPTGLPEQRGDRRHRHLPPGVDGRRDRHRRRRARVRDLLPGRPDLRRRPARPRARSRTSSSSAAARTRSVAAPTRKKAVRDELPRGHASP